MKLTKRQLADLKSLYETLDSKRHTIYLNEFLKADACVKGMIDTLRVLDISLNDFEQILNTSTKER